MPVSWNPWHGCHKISAGCKYCYVYRADAKYEKDSSQVSRNQLFDLPVRRNRQKEYKIAPGELVYTCFTSDFLLEDADQWREEAWQMIRERADLQFLFLTKRIHRFMQCIPTDWGDGYPNVQIGCTVENQDRADFRLPIFKELPIAKKSIVCAPLLGPIDLTQYLGSWVSGVTVSGESGNEARVCDYDWVLDLREQCVTHKVGFTFMQTGARLKKDDRVYRILKKYQHSQARKAGINYRP